jgi:hypothetical protein
MPAVNDVGEPCARERHARFEVAGAGNGAVMATEYGSPRETEGLEPGTVLKLPPRQRPDPTRRHAKVMMESCKGLQ